MPLTQVSSRAIEDTLRYVLGANGSSDYTFTGPGLSGAVNDPTLTLSRGHTYVFENRNSSGAHPFYIKTSIANGGTNDAYNTGVTNNGGAGGTEIVFTVPHDAPDLLYYQCSSHINMAGQLKIAGAVADGSISEAKLADDAVTTDKIADNAVGAAQLANNSVDNNALQSLSVTAAKIAAGEVSTAKIADDAVTEDKLANSINSAIAANTAKDLTALSASNLTSGTVPDARFPATLPAASAANLTSIPAANITGTLPAIDGSALTGISAGITMYDVWQYTSDVQGTQNPLSSHWSRAINFFDKIGTGMSQSNGIFTFPTTGKYHIWYKVNYYTNGNNSNYVGAYLKVTGNNSSYQSRSYGYGNFTSISGYHYDTASGDLPVDVTDTTNVKIQLEAGAQNQSVYIMGNNDAVTTGITFIRLGDT